MLRQFDRRHVAAALALAVAASVTNLQSTFADTYSFNQATGDFSLGANWTALNGSTGVVPGAGDSAEIGTNDTPDAAATAVVDLGSAQTVFSLDLGNPAGTNGTLNLNTGGVLTVTQLTLGSSGGTGAIVHNGGTLAVQTVYVYNGNALSIEPGDTVTGGGSGSFSVDGAGSTLTFNNTNTGNAVYTTASNGGTLNLAGGTLYANSLTLNGGAVTRSGGTVTVLNQVDVNGGSTLTVAAGDDYSAATINISDSGSKLDLAGVGLSATSVSITNNATGGGGGNVSASSSFTISDGGAFDLNGGTLTTATLQLGNNTAGTLSRTGGGSLNIQSAYVQAGSTLDIQPGDTLTGGGSGSLSVDGSGSTVSFNNTNTGNSVYTTVSNGATLNLTGGTLYANSLTLNGGAVTRSGGTVTVLNQVNVNGGSTLTVASGDDYSTATIGISDSGSKLDLAGLGLSASSVSITNNATGGGGGNVSASTSFTVSDGGSFDLNGGTLTTATLQLGNNTAGTLSRTGGGSLAVQSVYVQAGSTLDIETGDTLTGGGNGSLSVDGSGSTVSFNNTNTGNSVYTTVSNGATLNLAGGTLYANSLNVNGGTVTRSGGTVTVLNQVNVDGGSTLIVAAGDDYSAATVSISDSGSKLDLAGLGLSASSVSITNNATGGGGGNVSASSSFTISDGGAFDLNGGTLTTATLQVGNNTAGTLSRTGGGSLAVQSLYVQAGSTLDIQSNDTLTGGGNGSLSVDGSGSTLSFDNTNAGNSVYTTVSGGATLNLKSGTLYANSLNVNGGTVTRNGGLLAVLGQTNVNGGGLLHLAAGDALANLSITDAGSKADLIQGAGQITGVTLTNSSSGALTFGDSSNVLALAFDAPTHGGIDWTFRWADPDGGNHIADLEADIAALEITVNEPYRVIDDGGYTYIATMVPEPASLAIMGMLGMGLLARRRR